MKITPLDIQQQEFKRSFMGLDPREVRNFLDLCSDTVETVVRENAALREEVNKREAEMGRYRERERVLQDTLLTAQRMSEDMKASAHKEAEIILAQAELEGEKIVQHAQQRLLKLFEQIHELRRQKVQFETGMKRLIDWHEKLLEIAKESERDVLPEIAAVDVLEAARDGRPAPSASGPEGRVPRLPRDLRPAIGEALKNAFGESRGPAASDAKEEIEELDVVEEGPRAIAR